MQRANDSNGKRRREGMRVTKPDKDRPLAIQSACARDERRSYSDKRLDLVIFGQISGELRRHDVVKCDLGVCAVQVRFGPIWSDWVRWG